MEKEKENLSPNDEIIPSSQGSLSFNEPNTQRLCLELEDETEKLVPGKFTIINFLVPKIVDFKMAI